MKIPAKPPAPAEALGKFLGTSKKPELLRMLADCGPTTSKGQYLHWDELRHRTPPPGLTAKEWWAATKLARAPQLKSPDDLFKDRNGRFFHYMLPDVALADLHHIDQKGSGRIELPGDEIGPQTRDRYIQSSLIEEAITSSQLEGAATTREQAKAMIRSKRRPMDRSERMIFNNYKAMQFISKQKTEALSPKLVRSVHEIVTEGTMPKDGEAPWFRKPGDGIAVYDDVDNKLLHQPPPAKEIPERLKTMCRFANEKLARGFLHPVVRAILLHFRLAYDHPFVDGNGRTARALFYWSLLSQGYWLAEFISISSVLRKVPAQYSRSFLYAETDENDLTYFIVAQLRVIRRAMDELNAYLARKLQEMRAARQLLRKNTNLNYRQLALLGSALQKPDSLYTIASHQTSHNVAYQTARTDLLGLAERGYVKMSRMGRVWAFEPVPNLPKRLRG